jgi:hypothetical protein
MEAQMKRFLFALVMLCAIGCDTEVKVDLGLDRVAPDIVLPAPIPPDLTDHRPVIEYPEYERELPTVNLEQIFRQANWIGDENEGSCVHASMAMLCRWQGEFELADMWIATYNSGEYPSRFAARCDQQNVRYAYTSNENDVAFLEWACNTRRGAGVTVRGGAHMVCLVHLDSEWAGILDNNSVDEIIWVPRDQFLNEWMNSHSWAYAILTGTPPPPFPCL